MPCEFEKEAALLPSVIVSVFKALMHMQTLI